MQNETTYNVQITMLDTKTDQTVIRTIDKTNAMEMELDGFYMGDEDSQRENIANWIMDRANEQHETILGLVSWKFI